MKSSNKTSKKTTLCFLTTACIALQGHAYAAGEHDHGDLMIGSDADGGGNLVVDYPFDEIPVVPVSASGFPGLFTSTDPGFAPAIDEPLESVFELDVPTTVGMEITGIDANVNVQLGVTTMAAVGDAAVIGSHDNVDPELSGLHTHPQFLLSLVGTPTGEFAEGEFSFRMYDQASAYGDSAIHKLKLSNGYLPAIEAPTGDSLGCREAVAKGVRKLVADSYKRVAGCLDDALVAVALAEPEAAAKDCGLNPATKGSLAARLNDAHAKAVSSAVKACGELDDASTPFTLGAVSAHLGMASCRAQELASATYGEGRGALEEVLEESGGDGTCVATTCDGGVLAGASCGSDDDCSMEGAIEAALPCLKAAASHHED